MRLAKTPVSNGDKAFQMKMDEETIKAFGWKPRLAQTAAEVSLKQNKGTIKVYTDADWASSRADSRSTSGYVLEWGWYDVGLWQPQTDRASSAFHGRT